VDNSLVLQQKLKYVIRAKKLKFETKSIVDQETCCAPLLVHSTGIMEVRHEGCSEVLFYLVFLIILSFKDGR